MKRINAKMPVFTAMMTLILLAGSLFAQSGRPKVLVLRPTATVENDKVIEKFQWELADALDKSGKFDIVKKGDYEDAMKALNLDKDAMVPDSLVSTMMDTLQAAIFAHGKLDQPGGKKTELSAHIDYVIPRNDFTIEGQNVAVESEDKVKDLAKMATETLIAASERISLGSIARSYFNSAIYDKAIENYGKLLVLAPEDINVHYMIALSHLKAEMKQEAFLLFNNVLDQFDSGHIPSLEILASTSFADEDFENALKYYKRLAEVEPNNYDYTQYWAYSLEKLNRKAEAAEVYNKLIAIKDEDPNIRNMIGYYYYTLADSLLKAGDSTAALSAAKNSIEHMDRSVELCKALGDSNDPNWVKTHCNRLDLLIRGQLMAQSNEAALATLSRLVELNPADPYAYYRMASIAYDRKNWSEAVNYFSKALEVVPENFKATVYSRLARIYDKELNNSPKAIEYYTKSIPLLKGANKITYIFLRGAAYYDYANQLDYGSSQDVDMDQLIQDGKMTIARADQAFGYYDKAEADFALVTSGKLAKSAQDHTNNIAQLRDRLSKIKQQIEYYEKTK